MTAAADEVAMVLPIRMQVGDSPAVHVGDIELSAADVLNGRRVHYGIPRFLRAMADHIEATQPTTDPEGDTTMATGKTVPSQESNATIQDAQAKVSGRGHQGNRVTPTGGSGTAPVRHRNAPKPPEGGGNAAGPTRHPASPISTPSAVHRPSPA